MCSICCVFPLLFSFSLVVSQAVSYSPSSFSSSSSSSSSSFSSRVGCSGTCTLIGTSTNLVVVGLLQEREPDFNMTFFEIAQVGLPVLLAGMLYMLLASERLLPARLGVTDALERPREYITVVLVKSGEGGRTIAGKTITQAGLRSLPGLFLVQIERGEDLISAPGPETTLLEGDRLFFAGLVNSVISLNQIPGLAVAEGAGDIDLHRLKHDHILVEAVVANHTALINHTPEQEGNQKKKKKKERRRRRRRRNR